MNERAKYKLIGFIMMFASSSLMGGIGAFTRFIDAPGDFVSFWRNFAGLIALSIIFLFIGGFKKVKTTRFSGTMLLSGIFLGLLSGLYCLSTQYTTLANASFLIYTGPSIPRFSRRSSSKRRSTGKASCASWPWWWACCSSWAS